MKRFIMTLALVTLPWTAVAQGPQIPPNPEVTVYQQLLIEANDRLAKAAARAQQLEIENQNLKSRIAAEAKKAEPPKSDSK